jgi:hypothetical protein
MRGCCFKEAEVVPARRRGCCFKGAEVEVVKMVGMVF